MSGESQKMVGENRALIERAERSPMDMPPVSEQEGPAHQAVNNARAWLKTHSTGEQPSSAAVWATLGNAPQALRPHTR